MRLRKMVRRNELHKAQLKFPWHEVRRAWLHRYICKRRIVSLRSDLANIFRVFLLNFSILARFAS